MLGVVLCDVPNPMTIVLDFLNELCPICRAPMSIGYGAANLRLRGRRPNVFRSH